MTVGEFGRENALSNEILKNAFQLQTQKDLRKKLDSLNIPRNEINERIGKARTLAVEYESRNWIKIPVKFALWILFLAGIFVLMRRGKITSSLRRCLYLAAIAIFGVILGSDPGREIHPGGVTYRDRTEDDGGAPNQERGDNITASLAAVSRPMHTS